MYIMYCHPFLAQYFSRCPEMMATCHQRYQSAQSVGPIFGFVIRILAQFDSCYISYLVIFLYICSMGVGLDLEMFPPKCGKKRAKYVRHAKLPDMISGLALHVGDSLSVLQTSLHFLF